MEATINPVQPLDYPNCYSGYQYALDVLDGKIPNCKYIIGACRRFIKEFQEAQDPNSQYIFHFDEAERYLKLVQMLCHVVGSWETENITYLPWQKFVWMQVIGFRHRKDPRNFKFRTIHIEIPRGQGKSAMASQAALYFVGMDRERKGSHIYCFATKTDQARIVLDSAREMAKKSARFLKDTKVEVLAHKIVHEGTFSEVKALSSDSHSADGLNLKVAVCDELHQMSRELFEVITSGMKKRRDSLTLCITTAGFSVESIGYSQSIYAKKVALGEVLDDTFFSIVYTIDENDDIFSEETWKKANPNYGYSVDPVAFAATANKAKITPADQPNFKVKNLNIWLSEAKAFYSQSKWDECADPTLKMEDFKGKRCFVGIDLASKVDLACIFYVFKENGKYYLFDKTYCPEDMINSSVHYQNYAGTGYLISTPGEAINYPKLQEDLVAMSKLYKINEAYYDPWNATEFSQRMSKARIEMVEFRMNTASLSEPTKILDALMREKKIVHNGSPLLRWCIGNVVCKEDPAGNVFPKKSSDKLKIDPVVALIMALAGWLQEEQNQTVYHSRGIRVL